MATKVDLNNFRLALRGVAKVHEAEINFIRRRLAFGIYRRFIRVTPRDTGRAQLGWDLTIGTPSKRVQPAGDNLPKPDRSPNLSKAKLTQKIWLTNNVPYIGVLNQGHSRKAGKHFIQTSIKRELRDARSALRAAGGGRGVFSGSGGGIAGAVGGLG